MSVDRLSSDEIHLWIADYDAISDDELHSRYRALLSDAEKSQELRFRFAKDRRRYLVTRALVRTTLSRYVPEIAPQQWNFATNAYGRPEIANVDVNVSFNISHTHSLIVLGVTQQRALGVDIENYRAREISMNVADRYFAEPEVTTLNAAPSDEQQYRFFEYWTFKESYIKARGMGLSLPLDKFAFHYPHEHVVAIDIDRELADEPSRWHFWQLQPAPDYLLAVCAERIDVVAPRLIARSVVPMHEQSPMAAHILKATGYTARE